MNDKQSRKPKDIISRLSKTESRIAILPVDLVF